MYARNRLNNGNTYPSSTHPLASLQCHSINFDAVFIYFHK